MKRLVSAVEGADSAGVPSQFGIFILFYFLLI